MSKTQVEIEELKKRVSILEARNRCKSGHHGKLKMYSFGGSSVPGDFWIQEWCTVCDGILQRTPTKGEIYNIFRTAVNAYKDANFLPKDGIL